MNLCECGHLKDEHRSQNVGGPFGSHVESWCMAKVKAGNNRDFCPCNEFKPKEKL